MTGVFQRPPAYSGTWHPDGRRLLTISERRGRFDFYLWNVATTAPDAP